MSACDEWEGTLAGKGYGQLYIQKVPGGPKSGQYYAHRIVWMQDNGPIPDGMVIMHTCDNPRCINVEHLTTGTQSENLADMRAKGRDRPPWRGKRMCRNGHPYDDANTLWVKGGKGRRCKTCHAAYMQRYRASKAAA